VEVVEEIRAVTPPYYYAWPPGKSAPVKQPFQGPPYTRELWVLSITDYTNWNRAVLPRAFAFTRYQDATERQDTSTAKVPISLLQGVLTGVERGARTEIRDRLAERLMVTDFRLTSALGFPARYSAVPGEWPRSGSPEYQKMVATNLAALPPGGSDLRRTLPASRWVRPVVILLLVGTPLPLLLLFWRQKKQTNPKLKTD